MTDEMVDENRRRDPGDAEGALACPLTCSARGTGGGEGRAPPPVRPLWPSSQWRPCFPRVWARRRNERPRLIPRQLGQRQPRLCRRLARQVWSERLIEIIRLISVPTTNVVFVHLNTTYLLIFRPVRFCGGLAVPPCPRRRWSAWTQMLGDIHPFSDLLKGLRALLEWAKV